MEEKYNIHSKHPHARKGITTGSQGDGADSER